MPLGFDPPFCSCCMLMGADTRAIDTVLLPINLSCCIGLLLEGFQDSLPHPRFDPSIKSARNCAPRTIPLRQVPPRSSCSHDPQDAIENQALILCWTSHFWLLGRKQRGHLIPLLVPYFSSSHPSSLEIVVKDAQ